MNRLTTGLIISVIWLALLFSQSFTLLWLVFTAIGGLALHEYFSMCLSKDEARIKPIAIIIGLIPFIAALGMRPDLVFAGFFISIFASALLLFTQYARLDNGFILLTKLCCGLTLISLGASHLSLLVALPHGVAWLVILTIITIASDTGAYYAGSNFGKTKLCPAISPAKTVEGLIGGMIASLVLVMIAKIFLLPHISSITMFFATIMITLIGVGGDLTESIIKRSCRVKDSGTILPGHGGILDRIDSLLTAAPTMYYLIHFNLI
ncbi:MAG: phosphatidate cytidylyltransferase [Proteobacteria bacterium]|nr:phosphatidate cytidylyltransferase [Desulfobulbaceae bacterium]MBU4153027.1 phosphatidate cytidylyltransferase [Pseudomonadota bacterium]MDP2107204.1 phosphatidate cytidylyltransferase [Desulfobulbaceae bacterium]